MGTQDEVLLWLAEATLVSGGQEVSAFVVSDIRDDLAAGKTLDTALQDIREFDKKPGDFGAEILGALIVPVIIEAAKQLWSSYLMALTQQGGKQLASLTIDAVKAVVRRAWREEPDLSIRYAELVKAEAERQGLLPDQVDQLFTAIIAPRFAEGLNEV